MSPKWLQNRSREAPKTLLGPSSCRMLLPDRFFDDFSGFVASHYALSHRIDTPYWQSNYNKTWCEDLINLKPFLTNAFSESSYNRIHDFEFKDTAGIHCIATGMHWNPTDLNLMLYKSHLDKNKLFDTWLPFVLNLDKRKENWNLDQYG